MNIQVRGWSAFRVVALLLSCQLVFAGSTFAKPVPTAEQRTTARFDRISSSPPQLRLFLQAMPKGGDLHNHASGAVYAEDLLQWADEADLCVVLATNRLSSPPCDPNTTVPARGLATRDYPRYSRVIDALSTRGFEEGVGDPMIPGYDRFFFAIDSSGAPRDAARSFAIAREQAAFGNVGYLELSAGMGTAASELGALALASGVDASDFDALLAKLAPTLPEFIARVRADYDGYERRAAETLGCGTTSPKPGCDVEVRYQLTAIRVRPPAQVFAGLLLAFAASAADARFVGINIAGPEHDPYARRDYSLHMRMIAFLKARYPNVKLTLHAGELTLGLVPPRDLRSHIDEAVNVAGAARIGHGIDIPYEANSTKILARMASQRIAVEVNLTSNAVILGVKGKNHPLALYRAYGVPIVLGTDDEGLTRGDMTNEYQRAVTEQGLRYPDLKRIARNGVQYSFLPGRSLWLTDVGGPLVAACSIVRETPSPSCAQFLAANAKARQQYRLELSLMKFEAEQP